MTRAEILNNAISCVCTDREAQYGSPENNFGLIAKLWTTYLEQTISPEDVAMLMSLLKIARIKSGQTKADNYIDLAGYASCAGELALTKTKKVIAIDFDGTLCENKYPEIGTPKYDIIERAIKAQRQGDILILWTCRTEELLADAVDWCKQYGLVFDFVNENVPERIKKFNNDCRKIGADEYWDDKARRV
jgi:hypothetical protein